MFTKATDIEKLIEPELVLPSQWVATIERSGELRLLLANLENASRAFLLHSKFRTDHGRLILNELELWFTDPNDYWPFAFRTICDAFGLNPDRVWAKLQRMRDLEMLLPRQTRNFQPRNRTPMGIGIGGKPRAKRPRPKPKRTREGLCADRVKPCPECGIPMSLTPNGRPPERCPPCQRARHSEAMANWYLRNRNPLARRQVREAPVAVQFVCAGCGGNVSKTLYASNIRQRSPRYCSRPCYLGHQDTRRAGVATRRAMELG